MEIFYKKSNLTNEYGAPLKFGLRRMMVYNDTTIDQFKLMFATTENRLTDLKLNENTGTTAHDTSGNANNGTISGATWQNDGINITLVSLLDYTLSNNIFTLVNNVYSYNLINVNYDYLISSSSTENNKDINKTLSGISSFSDFWEIIVLAVVISVVIGLLLGVFGGRRINR